MRSGNSCAARTFFRIRVDSMYSRKLAIAAATMFAFGVCGCAEADNSYVSEVVAYTLVGYDVEFYEAIRYP